MRTRFGQGLILSVALTGLLVGTLKADQVVLLDGLVLKGKLLSVDAGVVKLDTDFAGEIDIRQEKVGALVTDEPVNVELSSKKLLKGTMSAGPGGTVIKEAGESISVRPERIVSLWRRGAESPADRQRRAAEASTKRHWSHELSTSLSGRTGVSENRSFSLEVQSTLQGPQDQLVIDLATSQEEDNGVTNSDDFKASLDYSKSLDEQNSWFAKSLFERDHFKALDMRRTFSLGLARKLIREGKHNLELRLGLNSISETLESGTPNDSFGAEITLSHTTRFRHASLETQVYFTRAFETPTNDRYHLETDLDFPLAQRNMKLRLSLEYEYNVSPAPGTDRHDLIYSTSLVFDWK
jgi:putative salt-induced outer membrane protein YdiY